MKFLPWLLLWCTLSVSAQALCRPDSLLPAYARVADLQRELMQVKTDEMDTDIPQIAADEMAQLKDSVSDFSDKMFACEKPAADAIQIEKTLAQKLHANVPEPPQGSIPKDDHRFDEVLGSYGHNLRVRVTKPSSAIDLIQVDYSINVECGQDHMLLIYELDRGVWQQMLRWQTPQLKTIADAFGDFFVSTLLDVSSPAKDSAPAWLLVVAHGKPWCTSRFSGFKIDLLSPGVKPDAPKVLWHKEGGYSRGDIEPKMKSSGNTFELRLNSIPMDVSSYERRVIYRYRVDNREKVKRIQPIATNARGFVEEWLYSPWTEARLFAADESSAALQKIHTAFEVHSNPMQHESVDYTYGPVRACTNRGTFQVQIDSTLEKMVPGKPGGKSVPLATHYFQVRELESGYLMLAAPVNPDPKCIGNDLMAPPTSN